MRFQPKIVYPGGTAGADITLTAMFGMRPWRYISKGVGGSAISKNGIPEAFEIRRDYKIGVPLVFYESEWSAYEDWIHWAQKTGQSFSFYFDKDGTTFFPMYLESPGMEEDIAPTRMAYIGAFELEIVLRSANATKVDVRILDPLVAVASVAVTPTTLSLSI